MQACGGYLKNVHCKKGLAVFLSPAGMSLTKLSLAVNNLHSPSPRKVWSKQIQDFFSVYEYAQTYIIMYFFLLQGEIKCDIYYVISIIFDNGKQRYLFRI